MDNLTHTLIGFVAGESIARTTRARESGLPPQTRRSLFVTLTVVGGNLPDLDLLYSYYGYSPAKLGYLLQHRGYTHTVLSCLLLAAVLYLATEGWARWRKLTLSHRDRLEIAGVAALGTLLHLAMDFLNSYGVHPFWPLENRWFYGDSVFIVEPLYWAAAATLFWVTPSIAWRLVIGSSLIAGPVVGLLTHLVTPLEGALFALLAITLLIVGTRVSPRTATVLSAATVLIVTLLFVGAGRYSAARVDSIAAGSFPRDRVIDRVLSPAPMNPLCWEVLLLETRGDRYSIRRALLSADPALVAASRCPTPLRKDPITAPLTEVEAPSSREIQWAGQFTMSRATLASLVARHCSAAELMQFARAPFAAQLHERWVIGDLRFDRGPGLGMAAIELAPGSEGCRSAVPWIPPRADLLRAAGRQTPTGPAPGGAR
ncbi:MAG TPA: metal-dependent hydrolase [Steroidobacteraceae bacterium]|nr:metal-dependent hydrolase [Steroidobacteraceae bacterium]